MAHWRATIHREGVPPRETDYRCWADVEVAEAWLDTRLMDAEKKAEREDRWDDAGLICDARGLGGERWGDLYMKQEDPGEWVKMGPFVEALGINYGIEGCECDRQEGIDVSTVLAYKAADVYAVLEAARERADHAAACYQDAQEEWRADPDKQSSVPTWVSMLNMAMQDAEKRRDHLLGDARTAEGRAMSQREAAARGEVFVCSPITGEQVGCGIRARVPVQAAYYDTLDCNWCGRSRITRSLGD